jgi:putative two-component system response regulator
MPNVNAAPDPAGEVIRHLRGLESRGSRGLVAQLIDSLMSESSGQMEAVRAAARSGDREALYRAAHSLQGSVAIVGADSVARACSELVKTARTGSFEHVTPIVKQVEAGIEAIRKALVGWTDGVPASDVSSNTATRPSQPTYIGRKRVLVIDDDNGIRRITQMLVEGLGHEVEAARDGIEGLAKLQLGVDLVLLDVVMPGLDGFDVCRRIRQDPMGKDVPVIMVTSLETREHRLHAVESGANDFIAKPVDETELRVRATSLLKMKEAVDEVRHYQTRLQAMCEERTSSLRRALEQMADAQRVAYQAQLETVERLAILAEYKDKVTGRHIQRMSEYSILKKPTGLDQSEWELMRQHSTIGSAILENSSSQILQAGRIIAQHHHERWDGAGYPDGLAGQDIPLWGRICAVGDVFDAITSERPYKPAFPNDEALQLLRDGRGTHFDPRVVDAFFESLNDILAIQEKYKDEQG